MFEVVVEWSLRTTQLLLSYPCKRTLARVAASRTHQTSVCHDIHLSVAKGRLWHDRLEVGVKVGVRGKTWQKEVNVLIGRLHGTKTIQEGRSWSLVETIFPESCTIETSILDGMLLNLDCLVRSSVAPAFLNTILRTENRLTYYN